MAGNSSGINERYVRTQAQTYAMTGDFLVAARWYAVINDKDRVREMCDKASKQMTTLDDYLMAAALLESVGDRESALSHYQAMLTRIDDPDVAQEIHERMRSVQSGSETGTI